MTANRAYDSPEYQNWLRQWKAVFITRRVLLPFAKSKAEHLHNDIHQKASNEQTCSSYHDHISDKRTIPSRFHEKLRNEIKAIHKSTPSWRNASTDTWGDSAFAVAKLFMQSSGYDDKSSFDEIDFNGLAAFIFNCGQFTPTMETLSDEARKYVSKIRHLPDICSGALTEKATTECIDSMYALLNDPDLQGDPEILEARKQLDQLKQYKKLKSQIQDPNSDLVKYIIEDSAIGGVQEIMELLFVKECKWSKQANEIRDDLEKLGNILMSSFEEQGESAYSDIKKTFVNALSKLDSSIDNAKKIKIETTEEGISKETGTAHSGKLEIEELIEDGNNELLETTLCGKMELKYTIEMGKKEHLETTMVVKREIKDTIESGKNELLELKESIKRSMKKEEEQGESKYTVAKSDLQNQLINHYKETARMNVRLDIDAAVEDIYEKPKLILKNRKDKKGKIKDIEISEMNEMFRSDNDMMAKTLFVEGEAGCGKSSLCKKIVHEWCLLKQNGNEKVKKNNLLSQFDFLFYIRLREVEDQCKIKDMVLQCLIEQIYSDDKESKQLLAKILKSERCLLLLDGLDEWTHCKKCKRDERIPHVETSWMKCTTLTTTRPYKLAELNVSTSQLGNHMQLQGVQSPIDLVRKVLEVLEKDHQEERHPNSCISDLTKKGLWHFGKVPIVLVHIVWLWYREQLKASISLSAIYKKIIEERWCEMNDKNNIQDNELRKEYLDSLSKLAFNKLFSANENDSIIFGITEDELEKEYKRQSLESGIMSCRNKKGDRAASYQFLHKTLQEYLSALYLANCGSDLPKHCQHIQKRQNRIEGVLGLRYMFLFLCGMNVSAAEIFSESLNAQFTENVERDGCSAEKARAFQNMILQGYEEAEKSGHTEAEFCLQHVFLGQAEKHKSRLKLCLDKRKSSLVSLYMLKKSDLSSVLQCKEDPSVLDLQTCKKLKFVFLGNVPYEDITQLDLNGLVECSIVFSGYKTANKLVSSFLSSDLTCLKKLTLNNLGWECKAEEIFSKLQYIEQLDVTWSGSPPNDSQFDLERLRHLEHLNHLSLRRLALSDVVNLHMLNLQNLMISFRTQKRAPQLMAALLAQSDDSRSSNLNGPLSILTDIALDNMLMLEGTFSRVVAMVIQSRRSVKCDLSHCTIEPAEESTRQQVEIEQQPALKMVAPQSASTDFTTRIRFKEVTMSEGAFRRVIAMVIQSQSSVKCDLSHCTIEPAEESMRQQVEMENQPALQMVATQTTSIDFSPRILLNDMTMSAEAFRRLVRMVIQAQHSVGCELCDCKIEPEDDVWQLDVEMENQPAGQMVARQPASHDYITHFLLRDTIISAGAFGGLMSMMVQLQHFVDCMLWDSTIESEEDLSWREEEMEYLPALQWVATMPNSTDYTAIYYFKEVTMSAGAFRRLVSMLIQSQHSVKSSFWDCTIQPEKDMMQLKEEMEKQPAVKNLKFDTGKPSRKWFIEFNVNV